MTNRHRTVRESVSIAPDALAAADQFGAESPHARQVADVARLGVLVRVTPDLRRELKLAAIERYTTVQKLMLEAVEMSAFDPTETIHVIPPPSNDALRH